MAVITISRESGARGSYIGRHLAEQLGYLYVDKELIHEVCLEYGVRQDEFEYIYEHSPGLLERYIRRNREIVHLIGRIIEGIASRGSVVIVGRGAFAVLHQYGDVMNVRLMAQRAVRIARLQEDQDLSHKKARKLIDRLDNERSKYISSYYGLDWTNSDLYHICMSTSRFTCDQTVDLILQALAAFEKNEVDRPLVRDVEVDMILSTAINESLNLLEATGKLD